MWWLIPAAFAEPCSETASVEAYEVSFDIVAAASTETWMVRYDPSACADGLELPEALGTAELLGQSTTDDKDGRLQRVSRISGIGSSGEIDPWGDVPAGRTIVRFAFGPRTPLQVHTDQHAHQYRVDNTLTVWWDGVVKTRPELIWTTWNDWSAAGKALKGPVERWVQPPEELGTLGRSLDGAELTSLVSRLDAAIDLLPPDGTGWKQGRPAREVLGTGQGTPSERGLILLGMLKGAGFDAVPAWFTPTDDPDVPRTLPAPHLLTHPAIAVEIDDHTVYLDPGVRGARPPGVPARMMGGRVLEAGKHIVIPNDTAAPKGQARLDATLTVQPNGRVVFDGVITPMGSAEQVMRAAFTGLEAQQWPDVVLDWIPERGEIRDLVVGVNGLDGLEPFSVTVRYSEPTKLDGEHGGLDGQLLDTLAPGLAQVLPPGVAIAERLELIPPEGMAALTAIPPEVERLPELVLNRSYSTDGPRMTIANDWHVLEGDADDVVEGQIGSTRVILFPTEAGPAKRAVKNIDLPELDQKVIRALLLYQLDLTKPADKQLKKIHKEIGSVALAEKLATYTSAGDQRPWQALIGLLVSEEERLAVIHGLEKIGDRRLAWQLATGLTRSENIETKIQAFVEVARLQGPTAPDAQADPQGHKAWRDPIKLLEHAYKVDAATRDKVRLPLIQTFLSRSRPMDAAELLDDRDDSAAAKAAEAEFGAVTGSFGVDVLGLIDQAVTEGPYDPDVRRAIGRAQAALGLRRQGVSNVLLAAELIGRDHTEWLIAAEYAARAGDLAAALYAARRASDLAPRFVEPALELQRYARLAKDEEQLQLGIDRLKTEMHPDLVGDLATLIERAPDSELALLRHHKVEVEADKTLLRRRAELHFARGMFEDAALDGSLLLDNHNDAVGARYMLAGVSSRLWHADPLAVLGRNGRNLDAREAKMDIEIVSGDKVRAIGDRAKTWNLVRRSPAKLAEQAPTWPVGMKDFEHDAPPGYEPNRDLSAVTGVLGWSSQTLLSSILRTERATGNLPPPIQNLYENGPTVLATDRGASVVRLSGGAIPIYAGITLHDGQDVIGLGLNPASARDAVLIGIGALSVP